MCIYIYIRASPLHKTRQFFGAQTLRRYLASRVSQLPQEIVACEKNEMIFQLRKASKSSARLSRTWCRGPEGFQELKPWKLQFSMSGCI